MTNADKQAYEFLYNRGKQEEGENSSLSEYGNTKLEEDFAELFNYKFSNPQYYALKLASSKYIQAKDTILDKYLQ